MIDRYFAMTGQRSRPTISDDSAPIVAASELFSRAEQPQRLVVVFGFWHAPQRSLARIVKRLNARQADVLLFDLNPSVLYQQPEFVRQSFEKLAEQAVTRASGILKVADYTSIDLLGFSLGNVPLCMAAQRLRNFNSATLVVPGSDLALSLWHGLRTQRLREAFVAHDISLETLQKEWHSLAPASHAQAFQHHAVTIYLARNDEFIPYRYGLELVAALENQGVEPVIKTSRFVGHALTINNYIRSLA